MTDNNHLTITLISPEAQKEVTVNEALFRAESILNAGAVTKSIATPPGKPVAGAVYIIPDNSEWPWTGKAGQIAYYDKIWRYIIPNQGLLLWVEDEKAHYIYLNGGWQRVNYVLTRFSWFCSRCGKRQA